MNGQFDLDAFLKRRGQHGADLLATLQRQKQFIDALNTDIGKELLKDALGTMCNVLQKIINEEATEFDRAEYRVLKSLTGQWAQKIDSYNKGLEKLI